jgi:hypothetical protein
MKMQVFANPRAGRLPLIEPDIDALAVKVGFENFCATLHQVNHFMPFFRCQVGKLHDVPKGADHEMTIIVGKFVHNYKSVLTPLQYQTFFVFIR